VERATTVKEAAAFLTEGGFHHLVLDSHVKASLEFLKKLAELPQFNNLKRAVCLDREYNKPEVIHAVLALKVSRIFYHPIEPRELVRELAGGLKLKTPAVPLYRPKQEGGKLKHAAGPLLAKFQEVSRSRVLHIMVEFPNAEGHPEIRRELQREAHKLKGSLGSFGFPKGSELARELETVLRSPGFDDRKVTELCRAILKELEKETEAIIAQGAETPVVLVVTTDQDLSIDLTAAAGKLNIRTLVLNNTSDIKEIVLSSSLTAAVVDLEPDTRESLQLIRFLVRGHVSRIVALAPEEKGQLLLDAAAAGAWKVLDRDAPPEQIFNLAKPLSVEGGRLRVLVVDDDPMMISHLKSSLDTLGLMTKGLCEPERFWDELEAWAPDMVLLDVDMPRISGIELCRAVRASSRWGELPVIILTSRDDHDTKFRVFRAGADDFITKPFMEPELRQRVANRLGKSRAEREQAELDNLTGLLTRRKAVALMKRHLNKAADKQLPMSVAIIDLDRFKSVNDTYGHPTGDQVLKTTAKIITGALREGDVVARWGGEEIVVGVYGMNKQSAANRLRQILATIQAVEYQGPKGEKFFTSFSSGVAQFPEDGSELDVLLDQADAALYRAKEEGRARVLLASDSEDVQRVDVALVEDDESLAEVIKEACEARCLGVAWFPTAAALLHSMQGERPLRQDLVIIDFDLPDTDGLTLFRHLRGSGIEQKVIMLSGKMGEEQMLQALDLGALECLQKPIYLSVLMRHVERALKT